MFVLNLKTKELFTTKLFDTSSIISNCIIFDDKSLYCQQELKLDQHIVSQQLLMMYISKCLDIDSVKVENCYFKLNIINKNILDVLQVLIELPVIYY